MLSNVSFIMHFSLGKKKNKNTKKPHHSTSCVIYPSNEADLILGREKTGAQPPPVSQELAFPSRPFGSHCPESSRCLGPPLVQTLKPNLREVSLEFKQETKSCELYLHNPEDTVAAQTLLIPTLRALPHHPPLTSTPK